MEARTKSSPAQNNKICQYYLEGYCKYGKKCYKYHPPSNPKICLQFKKSGFCKYGDNCHFYHECKPQQTIKNSENTLNPSKINTKSSPQKPQEEERKASEPLIQIKSKENNENNEKSTKTEEIMKIKHKPFIDFSKTELGVEILEKNKDLWGSGVSFFDYVKTLKNDTDIELCQLQRKYLSSFMWISDFSNNIDMKCFQIRHSPTIKRDLLELDFEIEEGYLWYEFMINWKEYPAENSFSVSLINNSIPFYFKKSFILHFKRLFAINHSIFKTLRVVDNLLDKICCELNKRRLETQRNKWTQEQQTCLENAIVKYRAIADVSERWKTIANEVPEKDHEACLERFKECREKALSSKNGQVSEDSSEEDNEENEEESEEIEENSEEDENSSEEEEKSEGSSEEIIEEYMQKSFENEFNVFLNINVTVNEVLLRNVGVISLEEAVFLVKCQKCREEVEKKLTIHPEFNDYLFNDVLCVNCNTSGIIILKRSFLHANCSVFGKTGSNSWDLLDLLTVNVKVSCEQCNNSKLFAKYMVGSNNVFNCQSCFKETQFSFTSYSLKYDEYSETYKKKPQKIAKTNDNDNKLKKIKKV